jgi:hypothetical protein
LLKRKFVFFRGIGVLIDEIPFRPSIADALFLKWRAHLILNYYFFLNIIYKPFNIVFLIFFPYKTVCDTSLPLRRIYGVRPSAAYRTQSCSVVLFEILYQKLAKSATIWDTPWCRQWTETENISKGSYWWQIENLVSAYYQISYTLTFLLWTNVLWAVPNTE